MTLTGTGTPGAATVTVTPSSLAFGSQALTTTSAPLSVTVKNTGTATVTFSGFTISGEDAGDFSVPLPYFWCGMQCDGNVGGGSELRDQRGVHAGSEWSADGDVESLRTMRREVRRLVALSGTGVTSQVIISVPPGGSYDGDDGAGRNGVLRIGDSGSAGSDGHGAAGMPAVVSADHVHRDTEHGDVERRIHRSGVRDTVVLPRDDHGERDLWRRPSVVSAEDWACCC